MAAVSLSLMSCATWDGLSPMTKKYTMFVGGALVAGAVSKNMVKDAESPQTTTALNALGVGTLSYLGADLYYSSRTEERLTDSQRTEAIMANSMNKAGRYIIDYSTGDTVYGPTRIRAKCQGKPVKGGMLCSAADGSFGDCSTNGFVYVSSHWAFQIAAFYSEDGCFEGPYTEPTLKDFSKSLLQRNSK